MKRIAVVAALVAILVAVSAGIAIAAGRGDDGDGNPVTGPALARASAAALASTGGGRVTQTEVGDEDGYYEIEVTLAGGGQVDVHLDKAFNVISNQPDSEETGDQDGATDN